MKAKRMVIKFCRAKALLPWLVKHFAFNYPPVNLLRHPGAVVASQRHASFKFPGWSDEGFRGFVIPDGPYNHFYTQHADFLETITTKEEQLTATWCMTNQVPLTHRRNNEAWINVYYEDLLFEAETEIERIFQTWGLPVPQGILEELRKPSTSAIDTTFRQSAEAQVYKWQRSFSPEQKARMQEILDYFGVEVYHMDDVMPNKP